MKDPDNGDLYQEFWKAAPESQPGWILSTSFNEWPEGIEIESSEKYGDQYLFPDL